MKFRMTLIALITVGLIAAMPLLPGKLAPVAHADVRDSEVLFRHKAWEVSLVAFDDGTFACMAQVGNRDSSFLLWAYLNNSTSLQFYNTAWHFDNEVADVVLRVDRRPSWTLNNSNLNQNSVFFNLNDSNASMRLLREVMLGNVLNLYNSSGGLIERYSLAGSKASILRLSDCVTVLGTVDVDNNPFN
ncbi:MAG: hypothetical protein KDA67_13695 [Rhodobacteraceae bacterium]|nr:hypothetical protein [Paracoccaceae bacterium]